MRDLDLLLLDEEDLGGEALDLKVLLQEFVDGELGRRQQVRNIGILVKPIYHFYEIPREDQGFLRHLD